VPGEGSRFILNADGFIQAIWRDPNPLLIIELDGILHGKHGNIIVYENGRTALQPSYSPWVQQRWLHRQSPGYYRMKSSDSFFLPTLLSFSHTLKPEAVGNSY
jgi:hypothetical protein